MTTAQIAAILMFLSAFGVDSGTITRVQNILQRTAPSIEQVTLTPQTPHAQSPITINTSTLLNRWHTYSPYATTTNPVGFYLSVSANIWADSLVTQGDQNISNPDWVTYSLDGQSIGHPLGRAGDYQYFLDTRKYQNGSHQLGISADDGQGNSANATLEIYIEN